MMTYSSFPSCCYELRPSPGRIGAHQLGRARNPARAYQIHAYTCISTCPGITRFNLQPVAAENAAEVGQTRGRPRCNLPSRTHAKLTATLHIALWLLYMYYVPAYNTETARSQYSCQLCPLCHWSTPDSMQACCGC